ncbi:unnamed protein product [Ilex paraguariensis]|uniref:Glycosyltransferase family 92 protein n=1 Tax=Ilex paraguariensis TaxID=185542 RepID=A0ABC8TZA1_9AQUA
MVGKEKEREKEKNMFVRILFNCAAEHKFLLPAVLFLCSLVTIFQFLPSRFSISSFSDLPSCISATATTASEVVNKSAPPVAADVVIPLPLASLPTIPPPPSLQNDQVLEGGIIKRAFNAYGSASYNFILMSSYRGGLNTFAIIGLAAKPLHVFGRPIYQCQWLSNSNKTQQPITSVGQKILPDWGFGRVYTVVVVNCTFPIPINEDNSGGKLLLQDFTNGGFDRNFNLTDKIEALVEQPGSVNFSSFLSQPEYDYLHCGSPLYGNLSPQRMREWLAYHVRLFGGKSHFVIYDAGGIHSEVMEVLRPWMEKGFVTLQIITEQERFDGYYHNQFLIVNDCLHRYRFIAKWMFFFDVDEFIFVPDKSTIKSVLDSLSEYTELFMEQTPMSNKLCLAEDAGETSSKWGFEKLVYKDVKRVRKRNRKYAIQPRSVFATGVHLSQNMVGKKKYMPTEQVKYFHYHGTIAERREPCQQLCEYNRYHR